MANTDVNTSANGKKKAKPVRAKAGLVGGKRPKIAKEAKSKPKKTQKELVTVNSKAMMTSVGPEVLKILEASEKQKAQANSQIARAETGRHQALAVFTEAVIQMAEADSSINLPDIFNRKEKPKRNLLLNKIRIGTGLYEYVDVKTKSGKVTQKLGQSRTVSKLVRTWTKTQHGNFYKQIEKCVEAGAGLVKLGADVEYDKTAQTLRISGPQVKKEFGSDDVLLNEKTTQGEGDDMRQLTVKPSFQKVADIAKLRHGIVSAPRGGNRGDRIDSRPVAMNLTSTGNFVAICKSVVDAINTIIAGEGFDQDMVKALRSLESAVTGALKGQ